MANIEHQRKYLQKFNEQAKIFKTQEDEQKVIDLYLSGKTTREIGNIFKTSKTAVSKVLKKNNITFRKAHESSKHKSKNQFGENNPAWKGGLKSIYDRIRGLSAYWTWHHTILNRDQHICKNCGSFKNLEVHHIVTLKTLVLEYSNKYSILPKNFTEKDLLSDHFYDLSNGITFCKKCHKNWHKSNGR